MVDFVERFGVVQVYYVYLVPVVEAAVNVFYVVDELRQAASFLPETVLFPTQQPIIFQMRYQAVTEYSLKNFDRSPSVRFLLAPVSNSTQTHTHQYNTSWPLISHPSTRPTLSL